MKRRRKLDKLGLFCDLGYEPHEGQLAVHQSQAPRRVLVCGVRWGKSLCAAYEAIAAALEPADESLGWIVAPSYDLCDRVFVRVQQVVEKHLAHRVVPIRNARRRILLRNMAGGLSEIRGKSADRPESLLGEGLDWLIVDEAARLKPAIWEAHLSERLVDRKGWALFSSTPRGRGWFHDLFTGAAGDPAFESWNFPSWTNPYLDGDAIEAERERLSQDVFDQEYGAAFLGSHGQHICTSCRPTDDLVSRSVVVLGGDEELNRCPECRRAVDEHGKALGWVAPDGHVFLKIVTLMEDLDDEGPEIAFARLGRERTP